MAIKLAKRLPFWLLSTFLEDFQVNVAAAGQPQALPSHSGVRHW